MTRIDIQFKDVSFHVLASWLHMIINSEDEPEINKITLTKIVKKDKAYTTEYFKQNPPKMTDFKDVFLDLSDIDVSSSEIIEYISDNIEDKKFVNKIKALIKEDEEPAFKQESLADHYHNKALLEISKIYKTEDLEALANGKAKIV
ncbi:MAG: hypothetical protein U0V72_00605 [Cytophagales bacterium]